MKRIAVVIALLLVAGQAVAMKNRERSFREPCSEVWDASVAVAKSHDYRIVTISREEQVISLVAGGAWNGERIITLALAEGKEFGCVATVQSRFSGWAHSDGPDLLSRVAVEILARHENIDAKVIRRYRDCLASPTSTEKCEAKLRKEIAAASPNSPPNSPDKWWPTRP